MAEQAQEASATAPAPPVDRKHLRKVVVASWLGSTVEFYDFLLYTSAASVVFPQIFFRNLDPTLAAIASFATLAIGFVARPLGGLMFGSLGDRLGRKRVMVLTMALMGVASTGIGLLPGYATVGVLAPLLLVLLRLLQGLAVGGEWGGAMAMSAEHSPNRRRGLAVAMVASGAPTGSLLASGAMGMAAALSGDEFLSWGWRVPFLASVVLVAIGLYLRRAVRDTPHFEQALERKRLVRHPARHIFARHWRPLIRVTITILSAFAIQGFIVSFALNHAVRSGMASSSALLYLTLSSVIAILVIVATGLAADRFGRRRLMLFGAAGTALMAFPMFWLLQTGTGWGVFVCFTLGHGVFQSVLVACAGTFIAEMFPVSVRTTASGVGYQLAGSIGGFTPLLAATLIEVTGNLTIVATVLVLVGLASTVAVLGSKETLGSDLPD